MVFEIEDEFTRLPLEDRLRLTEEWLDSLQSAHPVERGDRRPDGRQVRAEMGWS